MVRNNEFRGVAIMRTTTAFGSILSVLGSALLVTIAGYSRSANIVSQEGVAPERSYSVRLDDEGGIDSPLKASGQIVFHEELFKNAVRFRWQEDITYINATSKDIRAYEVEIDSVPERGGGFAHVDHNDLFFSREMLVPGSQRTLRSGNNSPSAVVPYDGNKQQPVISKANFTVRFVEFSDGTTYGNSEWGNSLPAARLDTTIRMKELQRAYQDGGDTALRSALAAELARPENRRPTAERLEHFKLTLEQDGPAALIAKIQNSLNVVKERNSKIN
jgi:hypothetical protein